MLELAPTSMHAGGAKFDGPGHGRRRRTSAARVILLAGCAQQVLRPEINDATIRLLARRGVDVVVPPGAGCCGALVHHMGNEAAAIAHGQGNIDAWTKVIERKGRSTPSSSTRRAAARR